MVPIHSNNLQGAYFPLNVRENLQRTLLAMQKNIQVTIHNSLREFAESVYMCHYPDRWRDPTYDGLVDVETNTL